MDNDTYSYYCKCYYFNDEYRLCKECSRWIDNVETTVEQHVNGFKAVVHAKRWKNNKNNTHQKLIRFTSAFIIEYMVYFN